ncbi:MAG: DNA-binding protein [Clostridia bacterium]|nr:DNA-binding protein [Clostridia bacterium]
MFQKDMNISLLLDFYGDILPERRRELITMYYDEDLSLSEIADIAGISRQGVRESIKKSEAELTKLEDTLGLAKRFEDLKAKLQNIEHSLDSAIEDADNEILRKMLISVKGEIERLDI